MHTKFNLKFLKTVLAFMTLLFLSVCASAQRYGNSSSDHDYGIALSAGYDMPVGNLSYTYKGTPVYTFSFIKYSDNVIISGNVGYHSYQPKQDVFYYAVGDNDYGTIKYKNFPMVELYLGAAYRFDLTDELKIYGGINLGAYYTHLVSNSADAFIVDSTDLHEEDLYIAGKAGVIHNVSDNISLGVEGKYNLFAPTGKKIYNDRVGTLYNSYTGGLSVYYNF